LLAAGSIIGTYKVLKQIGKGGMGTVYLGEHTLLGRKAAIKVLRPSLSGDEQIVTRFFNEARAVTRIADPGIVQVFDYGHASEGGAFIVMELLEGEPMNKRLKRIGRFGLIECIRLVRLICTSLGAAHAKGIVHRDLKPENIFIVADPAVLGGERAKILDFGIAKLSGDEPGNQTRTDVLIGTPMYMSPEQCRGGGAIDYRSDIYAMGCVMFAMLTGRPPFDRMGSGDLIAAHLREAPPLASSRIRQLPAVIDQIIQKCLRKVPAERFQSMAELARVLGLAEQTQSGSSVAVEVVDPAGAVAASAPMPPSELQNPGGEPVGPSPTSAHAPGWAGTTQTEIPRKKAAPGPPAAETDATLASPTTLRSASGQAGSPHQARRKNLVVSLAGTVAVIGAAAVLALRSADDPRRTPPLSHGRGGSSDAETNRQGTAFDGELATATPLAIRDAGAVVPTAADGGVPDASPRAVVFDAAASQAHSPKPGNKAPRPKTTGGPHDSSPGPAAPLHIDRTD
jgi:serine/threonine protein kinase